MKRTKIVATVGPACSKKAVLEELIKAGVNIFRLNFSHGSYADHAKVLANIRFVEKNLGQSVGVLADIQGPRIRISNRKEFSIVAGEEIFITDERSATKQEKSYKKEIILDWDNFYHNLNPGKIVFIEDGLMQLETTRKVQGGILAKVLAGGLVKPRKGVNIPAISHYLGFLTDKDLSDLEFILSQEIDFIGVSFVGNQSNLRDLRRVMEYIYKRNLNKKDYQRKMENGSVPWIISKIERTSAIKNIDEIIAGSDGVMVARGDLAIEEPQERVAVYQKDIIRKCRKARKPVIVATQMMSSMTDNARPTRAEISDVTNAVIDNADAVMLSNETAVGCYPIQTVDTMAKIIVAAEKSPYNDVGLVRSKLAKLFLDARKRDSRENSKIVKTQLIEEVQAFSSLRQEDTKIRLIGRDRYGKRKSALLWGVS